MSLLGLLIAMAVILLGLGWWFFLRQETSAAPVRRMVANDPIVVVFDRVHVEVSSGGGQGTLKGALGGVELLVHSQSFEPGAAPPLRGWATYYFRASDVVMMQGNALFSLVMQRNCLLLKGDYGGQSTEIAVFAKGRMSDIWNALVATGVRTASPPPLR